jgi:hypothetical protein
MTVGNHPYLLVVCDVNQEAMSGRVRKETRRDEPTAAIHGIMTYQKAMYGGFLKDNYALAIAKASCSSPSIFHSAAKYP